MTEDEALQWLHDHFSVPRETWEKLEGYVSCLIDGMSHQNLIAESTREQIWARHVVDSAQLLHLARGARSGEWVDLGAGAGLPGIIVSILSDRPVMLIESRRKRIEFLNHVISKLDLRNASVFGGRVEAAPAKSAAVISARAYAPLPKIFETALHLSDQTSLWVLPKGRTAQNELELVRPSWQAVFHVEPSVTDGDSAIIVARAVRPVTIRKPRA